MMDYVALLALLTGFGFVGFLITVVCRVVLDDKKILLDILIIVTLIMWVTPVVIDTVDKGSGETSSAQIIKIVVCDNSRGEDRFYLYTDDGQTTILYSNQDIIIGDKNELSYRTTSLGKHVDRQVILTADMAEKVGVFVTDGSEVLQ